METAWERPYVCVVGTNAGFGDIGVHMTRNAGNLKETRTVHDWWPLGRQGPQSHNPNELNFATNLSELASGLSPKATRNEPTPAATSCQSCMTLSREFRWALLGLLTYRTMNCEISFVLLCEAGGICSVAIEHWYCLTTFFEGGRKNSVGETQVSISLN